MHMLVKVAGFISTSQLKNTSCTWFLFTVAINWQTYHKMLWPVGHTIDLYFGYHCVNGHGMYPLSIDNYLLLWMLDDIPPHLSILRCIINAENYYYTEQVQESILATFCLFLGWWQWCWCRTCVVVMFSKKVQSPLLFPIQIILLIKPCSAWVNRYIIPDLFKIN